MKKLFLLFLLAPIAFIQINAKDDQCCNNKHHDRYLGMLYSDEGGSCIPGGGGGSGGGGPTDPPIPPMPPKILQGPQKLGVIAFNRAKTAPKIKFHARIKGVEGITGIDVHCRDIAGNDAGVGVTLKKSGWFDHGWEDGTGYIKQPDENNACNWESLDDIHGAVEKGEAFIRVKTEANPNGELSGDLLCIGFYNTDWF